jgi:hypothetical protein
VRQRILRWLAKGHITTQNVYTPSRQSFVGEPPKFFMRRYILLNRSWGKIYLHRIDGEDTAHLHSHPWSYVSIVLKGHHKEHLMDRTILRKPFSIAFRKHDTFHRLETVAARASWTLVLMGPERHAWGFLKDGQFVPHASRGGDPS